MAGVGIKGSIIGTRAITGMILTDREIQLSIRRGSIIIDPAPIDVAYSSTSVDLTLDAHFRRFKKDKKFLPRRIDPTHEDYNIDEALDELTTEETIGDDGFELPQKELILGWTAEFVNLPIDTRIAARVEGKSSLARLGIGVHMTAPTIHAGFKGQIQLEMVNHGSHPVLLRPGMRVCQLIFEMTSGTPDAAYSGQFQGQTAE
jgi:dCTP deaminase